jgi:hypothetical protein
MKLNDVIISEGKVKEFKNFNEWSKATQSLGAKNIVKSADGRKRFAVSDISVPVKKKIGEWDEKHEEGWVYSRPFGRISDIEIKIDSAVRLKEGEENDSDNVIFQKNDEVRKLIKKGAMDSEHNWINALDLVHRAYDVADVQRPMPAAREAWDRYEDNILFAVQMLQKATDKGLRDNSWKMSTLT